MTPATFSHVPHTLLILGTDAAGKDHIAHFVRHSLEASGHRVEQREGSFHAAPSERSSSEDKSAFSLLLERCFITFYPLFSWLMPRMVWVTLKRDLWRYRHASDCLLVVSHTGLRLLAFHLGHQQNHETLPELPNYLKKVLAQLAQKIDAKVIVLDVDHEVRHARVQARTERGKVDFFDRYMASDEQRSERIEALLVALAEQHMGAEVLLNNDLSYEDLERQINQIFKRFWGDDEETA